MNVAWFRPRPPAAPHPIDDTPSLVAELGTRHRIELYDERAAHDFVWRHWRHPYDVCVYELRDAASAAYLWPYLVHYPGIVRLRSASLRRSRWNMLRDTGRLDDYDAEASLGGLDGLGIPLAASRLTVVGDAYAARALQEAYPDARLRHAPLAVTAAVRHAETRRDVPVFGIVEATGADVAAHAGDRARAAGTSLDLRFDISDRTELSECDVIVSLQWPSLEPPLGALYAMAAGRPAIVYEGAVTAAWPAIEPQAWQPRGFIAGPDPVVVSIDLRDVEHSLMRAMQRLAVDVRLRRQLGDAALRLWRDSATIVQAAVAWEALLEEAAAIAAPRPPAHWPPHLTADGSERARAMLARFGVTVDLFS
jgi:hypothetical protein